MTTRSSLARVMATFILGIYIGTSQHDLLLHFRLPFSLQHKPHTLLTVFLQKPWFRSHTRDNDHTGLSALVILEQERRQ